MVTGVPTTKRRFMLCRRLAIVIVAACVAGCGGGGASSTPRPTSNPAAPFIAFAPSNISVRSSQFDFFGYLTYTARAGLVPKPISPANGALGCDRGLNVALQIHQGPAPIGVVHDQYVVLPLSVNPPKGTTLTCSSTWGLFDASGAIVAQAPLQAKLVYDTGNPAIYFNPAKLTLASTAGIATSMLAYADSSGFKARPVVPASLTMACTGGATLKPQISAGGILQGYVQDRFAIDPTAVTPQPPAGTKSVACSTEWGLFDASGNLVQKAVLAVVITYAQP